MKHIKISTQH